MKKFIIALYSIFFIMSCTDNPKKIIKTNTQVFEVEMAISDEQREQGLMNRDFLKEKTGMLFEFKTSKKYGFWMKNTLIPLDIVWISAEKKVVDIQTAQPCVLEPCKTYFPKEKSLYVLEVNANEFKGEIGETLTWK